MNKRINSCRVEWLQVLTPYEYCLLDKILFQSNLTKANRGQGWFFHVRTLSKETNISRNMVSKTLSSWPFINKQRNGYNMEIRFDYLLFSQWIQGKMNEVVPTGDNPSLQSANPSLPETPPSLQSANPSLPEILEVPGEVIPKSTIKPITICKSTKQSCDDNHFDWSEVKYDFIERYICLTDMKCVLPKERELLDQWFIETDMYYKKSDMPLNENNLKSVLANKIKEYRSQPDK